MTVMTLAALRTPTWAADTLREPVKSRIILHGVDCSIATGTVCGDERPVFDEAIDTVPRTAFALIETQLLEGGEASTLQPVSAGAVLDYFIDGGIAPEHVAIEGSTETSTFVDWNSTIAVQLSNTVE